MSRLGEQLVGHYHDGQRRKIVFSMGFGQSCFVTCCLEGYSEHIMAHPQGM